MPYQMTYKLAHAAAWDEGNRHARKHGHQIWNQEDYNAAVDEFNRLWPAPKTETVKPSSTWVLGTYAAGDWAVKLVYRLSRETYRRIIRVELGSSFVKETR